MVERTVAAVSRFVHSVEIFLSAAPVAISALYPRATTVAVFHASVRPMTAPISVRSTPTGSDAMPFEIFVIAPMTSAPQGAMATAIAPMARPTAPSIVATFGPISCT